MKILHFQPILKQILWGGDKIAAFKQLDCNTPNIGESWELSGVPSDQTQCITMENKPLNTEFTEIL